MRYYFISAFMQIEESTNPDAVKELKRVGNYFESEQEAWVALDKIKRVLQ